MKMKTDTEKELRELDAWIAEHVMGYPSKDIEMSESSPFCISPEVAVSGVGLFHPTTDPAAAMQVLEKCLERCYMEIVRNMTDGFNIVGEHEEFQWSAQAPTLPLAICKFANQLFSK